LSPFVIAYHFASIDSSYVKSFYLNIFGATIRTTMKAASLKDKIKIFWRNTRLASLIRINNQREVLLGMILVGSVIWFLLSSSAVGFFVKFETEAETSNLSGSALVASDSSASAGQYLSFGSPNGEVFAQPTQFGDWAFGVHEGGTSGFSATPQCWNGDSNDGQDQSVDHLVVNPTGNGFFDMAPYRIGALGSGDDVVTRVEVHYTWMNTGATDSDWYTLRHFGNRTGRLQQGLTQTWAWRFDGATNPYLASLGAAPSVTSGPIKWDLTVQFSVNSQFAEVTCQASVIVYNQNDPTIPVNAKISQNIAHTTEHPSVSLGLNDKTLVGTYQALDIPGLPAELECDGFDDVVSTADFDNKGKFRFEAKLGSPRPDTIGATDLWVFRDFGSGEHITWRDRTINLATNTSELNQTSQSPHVRLPDNTLSEVHGDHIVTFTSHYHLIDDLHDPNGEICEARVRVR
jgi:hypothetical protein